MADGYARATGKPGVLCIVPGPGVTNSLTGLGEALLDSVERAGIALAPDELCEGTNSVCLKGEFDLPLQFGEFSFQAHLASARALVSDPAVEQTLGLGFDLDCLADLEKYRDQYQTIFECGEDDPQLTKYGVYQ